VGGKTGIDVCRFVRHRVSLVTTFKSHWHPVAEPISHATIWWS
jgi:hypothetical protein